MKNLKLAVADSIISGLKDSKDKQNFDIETWRSEIDYTYLGLMLHKS